MAVLTAVRRSSGRSSMTGATLEGEAARAACSSRMRVGKAVEAVAEDLGLGPRLCGGGRRQALPRVEGGGDGLEIRGVRLAIPLTNELESTVVGEPAREAACQSVTLL